MPLKLEGLLLHQKTAKAVKGFTAKPAHGLLITGVDGAGKSTLAIFIASILLGSDALLDHNFAHISLQEGKQDIPIDAVRNLNKKMKLKSTGNAATRRVAYIENAHLMNDEAQNALLKLLEEPPRDTVIILTASSENALLPTIASRAQKINVYPVSLDDSLNFFGDKEEKIVRSSWLLSQGSVGLLSALLKDEADHDLRKSVEAVKEFIKKTNYERLLMLEKLAGDKSSLLVFLNAFSRVLTALSHVAIQRDDVGVSGLIESRKMLESLTQSLKDNASPKLVNLKLILDLKI